MQMFLRCLVLEPLLVSRHRSLTLEYGDRDSEIEKLKDCFDFIFPSSSAPVFVPLHPTALLSPLSATLLPLSLSPSLLGEGVESLERAKLSPSGSRLSLPHPLLPLGRALSLPHPLLPLGRALSLPHPLLPLGWALSLPHPLLPLGRALSLPHPLLPLGRAFPSPGQAPIVFPDASNDLLETMRGRAPTREGAISCFFLFLLPSLWYDVSVDNGR